MRKLSKGEGLGAKILLVLFSVVLVLGGSEVALSVFHPTKYPETPETSGDDPFYGILHQYSETPGLLYELAPNRQKKFERVWIRTNSYGMRDTEPMPIDDDGVTRIVVLGDSFTFGFRVEGKYSYPSVLERRLTEASVDRRFEVLNLGVCGYNTKDEAAVLEHKGLPWKPDLIVVGYVLNDPETEPIQPLSHHFQDPALWQKFNLGRLIAKTTRILEVQLWGGGDYFRYLHARDRRYWQSVVSGMDGIRRLAEGQEIPVLVVIFPEKPSIREEWQDYPYTEIHHQVAEMSRQQGFAVIDLLDRFSEFPARTMRVRRNDPHPSRQAHQVAAAAIHEWIDQQSNL